MFLLSNIHTSKEMDNLEPLPEDEEEEELIVLDPEHVCSFSLNFLKLSISEINILYYSSLHRTVVRNYLSVYLVFCVFSALVRLQS